jgi:hypothetical protein
VRWIEELVGKGSMPMCQKLEIRDEKRVEFGGSASILDFAMIKRNDTMS